MPPKKPMQAAPPPPDLDPSAALVDDLRKIVSDNLRLLRGAQRMTQRELASVSGISQKHISAVELTGSNLTLDLLARLSYHLGVTPAQMLTRIDLPGRR